MHYLVVSACGLDDIPLRLFSRRRKAEQYASSVKIADVKIQAKRLGRDTSIIFGVHIWTFNPSGELVDYDVVKEFGESWKSEKNSP